MKKGVFWLIDEVLLAVPYEDDSTTGIARSGDNYNHRILWNYVKPRKCNKPFNYYPRGRVEISNKGKPIVYMNLSIGEEFIPEIMKYFDLEEEPRIHYDGSNHYKSHFD